MSDCEVSEFGQVQSKVEQRIDLIGRELIAVDSSIALLKDFAEGRWTLKNKGYTRGAEHYQQTAADKARLPSTLANLAMQRLLLTRELEVLLEYGT